jgi:hypothetical protein
MYVMEEGKRRTSPGLLGEKKHVGGSGSSGGGSGGSQQHQGRGLHGSGKQFRGQRSAGGGWSGQQNAERRTRHFQETEYANYEGGWQDPAMDGKFREAYVC